METEGKEGEKFRVHKNSHIQSSCNSIFPCDDSNIGRTKSTKVTVSVTNHPGHIFQNILISRYPVVYSPWDIEIGPHGGHYWVAEILAKSFIKTLKL